MKAMLVFPFNPKSFNPAFPPLGILYIAAVLRNSGHSVKVLDAAEARLSALEVAKIALQFQPRLFGISCQTPQAVKAKELAVEVKKLLPQSFIAVGGPHPSAVRGEMLECSAIDAVVVGEGEQTFKELAEAIENSKPLEKVKGLCLRFKGKALFTGERPFIQDLDSLPFPAHELNLPLEKYKGFPSLNVMPSRGCPFNCAFCSNPVWGRRVRRRSAENVLSEIEWLEREFKIKGLVFYDDTFNLSPEFVFRLCDGLIERGLHERLKWVAECRANKALVSREMLSIMKESGCCRIYFGIESGSSEVLKNIRKQITLEEVARAVKLCRETGIEAAGLFMVGNIGETRQSILETIAFAESLALDSNQFTLFSPFPGSECFELALASCAVKPDFNELNEFTAVLPLNGLTLKDLEVLRDLAEFVNPCEASNRSSIQKLREFLFFSKRHGVSFLKAFLGYRSFRAEKTVKPFT